MLEIMLPFLPLLAFPPNGGSALPCSRSAVIIPDWVSFLKHQ